MELSAYFDNDHLTCKTIRYMLVDGKDHFEFKSSARKFTVSLKPDSAAAEGVYTYTVKAFAKGGASSEVTGEMVVEAASGDDSAPETSDDDTVEADPKDGEGD